MSCAEVLFRYRINGRNFPNIHLYKALSYARNGDKTAGRQFFKTSFAHDVHARELFDQIIREEQE
jgi:hypothetical protein